MADFSYPTQPEFKTVKDQFMWYLKRFMVFSLHCAKKAQIGGIPEVGQIDTLLILVGDDFVIGKTFEIVKTHGEGLKTNLWPQSQKWWLKCPRESP